MTLDDYLRTHGLSEAAFGARVGVRQSVVHRWRTGQAVPRREWMARIVDATGRAVQPTDFYAGQPMQDASSEVAA